VKNQPKNIEQVIGVISDTHGLLRPEAVVALRGVELILHAGDLGSPEVLDALKGIAPVVAVRGNNDKGAWAEELPPWEVAEVLTSTDYADYPDEENERTALTSLLL